MLKGKKCYIRPLVSTDIKVLNEWNQDEELMKFLGNGFHPVSIDIQKEWLNNMIDTSATSTNKRYMICDENDIQIGLIGLYSINWINRSSEVGIYIGSKELQNKGIATEAYSLLELYIKNYLNLRKLKVFVVDDNIKAMKFWKKNGFVQKGVFEKERFISGRFCDLCILEKFI